MAYTRYYKPGQKILLRLLEPSGRFEALTTFLHDSGPDTFDLDLPYQTQGEERYPFTAGMPFELMSDHLGLGLRLTGRFREPCGENRIRVEITSEPQVFQRRLYRRLDTTVGLRFTKGRGTLRSFRDQWQKNLSILDRTPDFSKLPPFPRTRVNLSAGGIRFDLASPLAAADLCLVLLQLEPNSRPICALAEVVWLADGEGADRCSAGMQFIGIQESDKKLIENLIKHAGDAAKEPTA